MKTKGITKESSRKAFTPSEMRSIAASRKGKEKTPAFREYTDNARQYFVRGFTLIELLVVIAILAILMVAVVMALNPSELLKQARDSNRLSDLSAIKTALALYQTDVQPIAMGNASTSYLSLYDAAATGANGCPSSSGLPSDAQCAASSTYRLPNSTGWIPVDLTKISIGSPLAELPVDPINSAASNLYYTYATDGTYWEVSANAESQKFKAQFPQSPSFTVGTSMTLIASSSATTTSNPAPILTSISPTSTTAGGSQFTLTLNGSNFIASSTADWNGSSLVTTFIASNQLTATVPSTDITSAGTATITAVTPAPGGGTSGGATFTINTPPFACGTSTVTGSGQDTTVYHTVLGADGNCWLASNLGTANIANSVTDSSAYGWLYQWGRLTDGHQVPTSAITTTLSTTDVPGNADYIYGMGSPYDWRSPQNDNLWQGTSTAINNPCPTGWSIPTDAQWSAWVTAVGLTSCTTGCDTALYDTSLKLTDAGNRNYSDASLNGQGAYGDYWSSSVVSAYAYFLDFISGGVSPAGNDNRADGFSARCIKD